MKEHHLKYLSAAEQALGRYDTGPANVDDSEVIGDIGFAGYRMVKFRATGKSRDYLVTVYDANGYRDIRDSLGTIKSHGLWLQALSTDTDLVVQVPVLNESKETTTEVRDENGRVLIITILDWVEGELLSDNYAEEPCVGLPASVLRDVGAVLAAIHNHSSQWSLPAEFHRPESESEDLPRSLAKLQRAADEGIKTSQMRVLTEAVDQIRRELSDLRESPQTWGLIHGDFSCGNCVSTNGAVRPIDFDWCCYGYYASDVAWSFVVKDMSSTLRNAFWDGYRENREAPIGLREVESLFIESWIRLESWGAGNPKNRFEKLTHFVENACLKYLSDEPFVLSWSEPA